MSLTYSEAIKALDALYAELPDFVCQKKCQDACGVIAMTRVEWLRITRKLGYKPKGKPTLVCPMLKQGRCSIYAIRPTVCRLFGLMDKSRMHCPWGCQPAQWLTEDEGYTFLMRVEEITQQVFPQMEAPEAWSYALRPPSLRKDATEAWGHHLSLGRYHEDAERYQYSLLQAHA